MYQHTSTFTLFLFTCLLALSGSPDTLFAEADLFNPGNTPAELRYNQAKDYYYLLRSDEQVKEGDRQNWLNGISEFRKIYLDDPGSELAPNCLFMMATMHYRMFLRFQMHQDIQEAVKYYRTVWERYPGNSLADDALYWAAEMYYKHKSNPQKATDLLAKQIKDYPDGDKYAQAVNRLREINALIATSGAKASEPVAAPSNLNKVLPVQYWSSDDYTRVVIRASAPVTHTSSLSEQTAGQPRRLLLDFAHSSIDKQYTAPIPITDGLLQKIQSGQIDPATVRIALDFSSVSTYKIFSLNDPFRVIVDVYGLQNVLTSSKAAPKLQKERVEPVRAGSGPPQPAESQAASAPAEESRSPAPDLEDKDEEDENGGPFIVLDDFKKWKPGAKPAADGGTTLPQLSLAQQLGLGVRRIVIDPGHGGKDPGAMGSGLKEKDITLNVARKTAELLQAKYQYDVLLTRDEDRYLPLEERTAIANTMKTDLFISIHVNAHPNKSTRGIETYTLGLASNTEAMRVAALENATSSMNISDMEDILTTLMQNSKKQESSLLANYVQNQLVSGLRENKYETNDLGVKQAPFYVLTGADMPAILAEISFISNPKEAKWLKKEQYLEEIARQLSAGISEYVNHPTTAALY